MESRVSEEDGSAFVEGIAVVVVGIDLCLHLHIIMSTCCCGAPIQGKLFPVTSAGRGCFSVSTRVVQWMLVLKYRRCWALDAELGVAMTQNACLQADPPALRNRDCFGDIN